jgi:hypothetical protein
MINDPVILRLDFRKDRTEEIAASRLANLVAQLEKAFTQSIAKLGPATVEMRHVAAPARGSLEFYFAIHVTTSIDFEVVANFARAHGYEPRAIGLQDLGAAAGIGSFIFALIFGGRGLIDLANLPGKAPKVSDIQPGSPEHTRASLAGALSNPRPPGMTSGHPMPLNSRYPELVAACRESGANKVQIELPDEPAVCIYDY